MNPIVSAACSNYKSYMDKILVPATLNFLQKEENKSITLPDVFGTNLFIAHAIDYIAAIRKVDGIQESRSSFVKEFDNLFGVTGGSRFQANKFELIDAINNALKHIQLDESRYKNLTKLYGSISFNCLVPQDGRVLCILDDYRFDYSRVILRPAIRALTEWDFEDLTEILEFARGSDDFIIIETNDQNYDDSDDPIEQMIEYCHPKCADCEEYEDDCMCATYVYNGENGYFNPQFNPNFNFDEVMSRIYGSYSNNS